MSKNKLNPKEAIDFIGKTPDHGCMNQDKKKVIAAFDFDCTLTKRDSMLPFLAFSAGRARAIRKLIRLTPNFLTYMLGITSRQEIKERMLSTFFAGIPDGQLRELGEEYAKSDMLKKLLLPEAIKRLEWHKRQNHYCVLVSASVDAYLVPWGQEAGFNQVICSEMEIDSYGIVTGKLKGENCWGPEKERRLIPLLEPRENSVLYAYGDSRGDREMLALADHKFYRAMS